MHVSVAGWDEQAEDRRTLTARVLGINPGEDPYHTYVVPLDIDSGSCVRLTAGNGTHQVRCSPIHRWYVEITPG